VVEPLPERVVDDDAALLSDHRSGFMHESRTQSFSYSNAICLEARDVGSYHDKDHMAATSNRGMELDLESYFYDIEGLLSDEDLDWFTGAVL